MIQADFCARTLDSQPVQGVGILRLLRVTYRKNDKQMQPVETEMQHWALNTDERGTAQQKIKADQAGQYRLRYQVTDAKGHTIEGGYLFTITEKDSPVANSVSMILNSFLTSANICQVRPCICC